MIVNPVLKFPAISQFTHGGPVVPGNIFPFVFITIMCGAISGFHALVSSGTTPKMISCESHARSIGYGCMLLESLVGIVCLLAACAMEPGDYYAINVPVAEWGRVAASYGLHEVHLQALTAAVGEATLRGRSGGSVLLAVGMAQIFSGLPGLAGLMQYWYHFAIMFEALFILTTIDAGTRIARFLLQEFMGKVHEPFGRADWLPGSVLATALVVSGWGWLIWNASIRTIWPMFGIANQMLAAIALCIGTRLLINSGRGRYAWTTLIPLVFVTITTTAAGVEMIFGEYWPASAGRFVVDLNIFLILLILGCAYVIFAAAFVPMFRNGRKPAGAAVSTILLGLFLAGFAKPARAAGNSGIQAVIEQENGKGYALRTKLTAKTGKTELVALLFSHDSERGTSDRLLAYEVRRGRPRLIFFDETPLGRVTLDPAHEAGGWAHPFGGKAPFLVYVKSFPVMRQETLLLLQYGGGKLLPIAKPVPFGRLEDLDGDGVPEVIAKSFALGPLFLVECRGMARMTQTAFQTAIYAWRGGRLVEASAKYPAYFRKETLYLEGELAGVTTENAGEKDALGKAISLYFDYAALGWKEAGWKRLEDILRKAGGSSPLASRCIKKIESDLHTRLNRAG